MYFMFLTCHSFEPVETPCCAPESAVVVILTDSTEPPGIFLIWRPERVIVNEFDAEIDPEVTVSSTTFSSEFGAAAETTIPPPLITTGATEAKNSAGYAV